MLAPRFDPRRKTLRLLAETWFVLGVLWGLDLWGIGTPLGWIAGFLEGCSMIARVGGRRVGSLDEPYAGYGRIVSEFHVIEATEARIRLAAFRARAQTLDGVAREK